MAGFQRVTYRRRGIFLMVFAVISSLFLPVIGFVFLCGVIASRIKSGVSYLESFIAVFLAALIVNAFIYQIFDALGLYPNVRIIGVLYALVAVGGLLRYRAQQSALVSSRVVIALIAAVIVFIGVVYPVTLTKTARISHPMATIHLLSGGEDNASHYALYKYAYIHNGYAYTLDGGSNSGLIKSLENYPQGGSLNIAWLTQAVIGSSFGSRDAILIQAFYGFVALFYSLLTFLVLLIALAFYEKTTNRKPNVLLATVGILIAIGTIAIGPSLYLLGRGFQSQIFSFVYLMLLIYAASPISDIKSMRIKMVAMLLAFSGICISWWFLAPVAASAILCFALLHRKELITYVKPVYIVTLIVFAIFAAYPTALTFLSGATNGGSLNQQGGVDNISYVTLLLFGLGCAPLFMVARKDRLRPFLPLIWTLFAWVLFTLVIGAYQQHSQGYFSYYYYKSLYTLLPLSGVLIIFIALITVDRIEIKPSRSQQITASLLLGAVFMAVLCTVKPVYPRVYANDWFSNPIVPTDFNAVFQTPKDTYTDLVYVGGCSPGSAYIMSRWSGAAFQSEVGTWHRKIELYSLYDQQSKLQKLLSDPPEAASKTYVFMQTGCQDDPSNRVIADLIRKVGYPSNLPEVNQ